MQVITENYYEAVGMSCQVEFSILNKEKEIYLFNTDFVLTENDVFPEYPDRLYVTHTHMDHEPKKHCITFPPERASIHVGFWRKKSKK